MLKFPISKLDRLYSIVLLIYSVIWLAQEGIENYSSGDNVLLGVRDGKSVLNN
jgi:hypothetical protein